MKEAIVQIEQNYLRYSYLYERSYSPRWVGETATLLDKARTKTLEGLTLDHKEVLVTGIFVSRIDS